MSEKQEITNEDVLNSSAFRVLNLMIDRKAAQLKWAIDTMPDEIKHVFDQERQGFKATEETRVWEEQNGDETVGVVELAAHPKRIEQHIGYRLKEISKLDEEIAELRRMKCVLLNDYDFSRGDDNVQRHVILGEPLKDPE